MKTLLTSILKLPKQEQRSPSLGFTLLEVLVSMFILTAFLLASLQLIVMSAVIKVKNERLNQLFLRIQEEIDNDYAQAAILNLDHSTTPPSIANQTIHESRCQASSYDNSYAKALQDLLNAESYPRGNPITIANVLNQDYRLQRSYLSDPNDPEYTTNSSDPDYREPSTNQRILYIKYTVCHWDTTNSSCLASEIADLEDYAEIIPEAVTHSTDGC
jgi:type II secretory pathway pseudopilin PulG